MASALVPPGSHPDEEEGSSIPAANEESPNAPAPRLPSPDVANPGGVDPATSARQGPPDAPPEGSPLDRPATHDTLPISASRQYAVMVLITLTQLAQMYPYGAGIGTGLSIAASLHDHTQTSSQLTDPAFAAQIQAAGGWIAASYPSARRLLAAGCVWWTVWQLGSGFARGLVALCVMRGLSGVGGALMVPNAVAMLGITLPPGPRRNLAFGMFGAMAPVGAAGGALIASAIVQLAPWKWGFFFAAMLGAVVFTLALVLLPGDTPVDPAGRIDWIGAYLGVAGLILFNFVWNQAPAVGWPTPYIYALLLAALLHLALFVLYESRVATSPILPFTIWRAPSFGRMLALVFCSFMSQGIYLWYTSLFSLTIRHYSLIEAAAHYQPLTLVGTAAAFLSAWLVARMPAQYTIAIGNLALVVANTLVATAPRTQSYWAMLFPSIVVASFAVDFIFAASQVIASGSVGRKHQGVAGSLIGTLLTYGLSTGLGFAGTVEAYTNDGGQDVLKGYRNALYLGTALAGMGLTGSLLFLRVPKSTQEGWDEKLEVELEGVRRP
ncbi:hypothetical protein LTR53_011730 [Teratosphaeriaceae sp. CCFEE 6253]|nr:hypothetical protein LTR53_011730 [Teratosphaeriaceae sp. CCFEE 6253]